MTGEQLTALGEITPTRIGQTQGTDKSSVTIGILKRSGTPDQSAEVPRDVKPRPALPF